MMVSRVAVSRVARRARVALAGVLLGALLGGCTDARLAKSFDEDIPVFDNKVALSGKFCTSDPSDLQFPLKVLFVIDTSQSMNVNDPLDLTEHRHDAGHGALTFDPRGHHEVHRPRSAVSSRLLQHGRSRLRARQHQLHGLRRRQPLRRARVLGRSQHLVVGHSTVPRALHLQRHLLAALRRDQGGLYAGREELLRLPEPQRPLHQGRLRQAARSRREVRDHALWLGQAGDHARRERSGRVHERSTRARRRCRRSTTVDRSPTTRARCRRPSTCSRATCATHGMPARRRSTAASTS